MLKKRENPICISAFIYVVKIKVPNFSLNAGNVGKYDFMESKS
jgi:hypothetical protein